MPRRRFPVVRGGTSSAFAAGLVPILAVAALVIVVRPRPPNQRGPTARRSPMSAPFGWGVPERASLDEVRAAIAREEGRTGVALARCETSGASAPYVHCAFRSLARVGAAASITGVLLFRLTEDHRPAAGCRALITGLGGSTTLLADVARSLLRNALGSGARWGDVRAGSRAVRGLARDGRRFADSGAFGRSCGPRPEAVV